MLTFPATNLNIETVVPQPRALPPVQLHPRPHLRPTLLTAPQLLARFPALRLLMLLTAPLLERPQALHQLMFPMALTLGLHLARSQALHQLVFPMVLTLGLHLARSQALRQLVFHIALTLEIHLARSQARHPSLLMVPTPRVCLLAWQAL